MTPIKDRITAAVDSASEAFWRQVTVEFPECKTGDFPPLATNAWDIACREAIEVWVLGNLPTPSEDRCIVVPSLGSVYYLESEELMQVVMDADGSYDLTDVDSHVMVDWDRGVEDRDLTLMRNVEATLRSIPAPVEPPVNMGTEDEISVRVWRAATDAQRRSICRLASDRPTSKCFLRPPSFGLLDSYVSAFFRYDAGTNDFECGIAPDGIVSS